MSFWEDILTSCKQTQDTDYLNLFEPTNREEGFFQDFM